MLYILFALRHERYGYTIMQYVRELTAGRVVIGAGTMYGTLVKLEKSGLVRPTKEQDRQKYFVITDKGLDALRLETLRLQKQYNNLKEVL